MNTNNPFQSRWGFHPCNYDLFLKLKYLHKWYWQTLYDFHRWHRWWRKREENRSGREPEYCPDFVVNELWYKRVRTHDVDGFKVYPRTVVDLGILVLYQAARMPQPAPVEPFDAETVLEIDKLYARVMSYVAK